MRHLILAYDLSYLEPLRKLARTTSVNLWIVINPNNGPQSPDRGHWRNLIKDVNDALRQNPNHNVSVTWFGYVDLSRHNAAKGWQTRAVGNVQSECIAYATDYGVNNLWADDCFADKPEMVDMLKAMRRARDGVKIIANAGEWLPMQHALWQAADYLCVYEANEPSLHGKIGTGAVWPAKSVRIAQAKDRAQALELWRQGQQLKLAALAIVERDDYQDPAGWW